MKNWPICALFYVRWRSLQFHAELKCTDDDDDDDDVEQAGCRQLLYAAQEQATSAG